MKEHDTNWIRIAISPSTREEGRKQLATLAAQQRWFISTIVQASGTAPFEIVYNMDNAKTSVHYIQDKILGLDLVLVQGETYKETAELIRSKVKTILPKEAIEFAKNNKNPELFVNQSYILAATGPSTFDQETFDIITGLMKHENADARHGAIIASGYLEWPEFTEHFKTLMQDPDENVRKAATVAWEHASKN